MAIWIKLTDKQEKIWEEWLASRPQVIKDLVVQHNLRPDRLYLLRGRKRVKIASMEEDGTVTVEILTMYNPELHHMVFQNYAVFGINPADLTEADWDGEVMDGAMEDEDGSEG